MAWISLALRRLRRDLAASIGLALLVLVTALVAAAAPRVLASRADQAVTEQVGAARSADRSIVLQERTVLQAVPQDPLAAVRDAGARLEATLPASVRDLVSETAVVVESGRFRVDKRTTDAAFVRLRIQEGVEPYLAYVAGRPPTGTVTTRDNVGPEAVDGVPVYEVAISAATAARFGIALDEVVPLKADATDAINGRRQDALPVFVRITGIYEVPAPDDDVWLNDPQLAQPVIRALSAEIQLLDAALVLAPDAYGALVDHTRFEATLQVSHRIFLDTGRITGRSVPALVADLQRLRVLYPSANVTSAAAVAMRTGLPDILARHQARWTAAESILAVLALGPALVAAATLALVAILAARRRRLTLSVARSRGASPLQVLVPALVEGSLIAIPSAIVAILTAVAMVPSGHLLHTVLAAGVTAVVAIGVVVATVVPVARAQGPAVRPGERTVGHRLGGRRVVGELLVVGLAIVGAVLLRGRGVRGSGASGTVVEFDPLITAVPALVGLAAGLLAIRLYPLLMGFAARLGRRRRGLVAMLAARRATEGGGSAAILLVLLATATVGSFAMTALDHLERGADIAAWRETGAAYRILPPSGALPSSFDPAALPGAEAVATVFQVSVPVDITGPQVAFSAPEAASLSAVLAGTPLEPAFPPGFADAPSGPIPAIISQSLVESPRGVPVGGTFVLSVEGYALEYRAIEARDTFPGVASGHPFVVVAGEALRAAAPKARLLPVVAYVRASASAAAGLRAAASTMSPLLDVTSQAEDAAARRRLPVTGAVRSLVLAAALVTALYAGLGVAAALALAGLARISEVAHLRTLGLTGRQATALVVAEHGPTAVAAFTAGVGLGIGLFALLRGSLGLDTLTGAPADLPVTLDPGPLLLILAAMAVVIAAGLLLGAALQRRVAPTAALRGGFD